MCLQNLTTFCYFIQYKKAPDSLHATSVPAYPPAEPEASISPKYSDMLSPAVHEYLNESSRQESRVCQVW
jgi:hypothetical protein